MRLIRFGANRIGIVEGDQVRDATAALTHLPGLNWPQPHGDALIAALDDLRPLLADAAAKSEPIPLSDVSPLSPVARPSKVIAAPVNYMLHYEEARDDVSINHGMPIKTIDDLGLFLKSTTSVVGPGNGVVNTFPERRVDHEIELAVIIGKTASRVPRDQALDCIAGYCIGLDMSVRGTEDRSWRKSMDSFTVLGPTLVTPDEVADPNALDFRLKVNGADRQVSNTRLLIFDVQKLISYASMSYTLYPGDVILTGTPEGVAPVVAGDHMHAWIEGLGEMSVAVHSAEAAA